jgi:hypothetical protein
MMPDWDIHPEMISHTWVIDIKTGRPYLERTGYYIENDGWSQDKCQLPAYCGGACLSHLLSNAVSRFA